MYKRTVRSTCLTQSFLSFVLPHLLFTALGSISLMVTIVVIDGFVQCGVGTGGQVLYLYELGSVSTSRRRRDMINKISTLVYHGQPAIPTRSGGM
ncbi:hypothetical protein HOY82DRAFT_575008, partial [Tuber indicum]